MPFREPQSFGLRLSTFCAILLLFQALSGRVPGADDVRRRDCGSNALFLLLELEGRPTSLDRLDAALPARHRDGYSMAELATAARLLGLELEGRQLSEKGGPPSGPAIAFFQDTTGGHFSVIRPVGTTNTMVQVIDPPQAPRIVDYVDLVRMPTWTGRTLQPAPAWHVRHASPLLAAVAGLVLLTSAVGWRHQRVRATARPTRILLERDPAAG